MKIFWKVFYTLAAIYMCISGFMYWHQLVPADNITLAIYSWVIAFTWLAEAIRRE